MNIHFVRMIARPLQCFFLALLLLAAPAQATELLPGNIYHLTFTDIDQRQLSTAEGRVTIITVVTRPDESKAQTVGHSVPKIYLGDPKYRLVTMVNFQQKIFRGFRGMITAIIRSRLNSEAKELKPIYAAKHLTRDPRQDIFVVADFDGKSVSQLGIAPTSGVFAVFVFDGQGRLLKRWNDAPPAEALSSVLREAH
jgi:hypothetical protein